MSLVATVHGVSKSRTWLSDYFFYTYLDIIFWRKVSGLNGVAQSRTWLKWLSMHACLGEGNGNPFQYSCLENSRDRRAWWAAIDGVTQSRTLLKRLSSSSSMVVLFLFFFFFKGISILSSIVVSIYIPTNSARGFLFFHTLSSIYCL